VRTQVCKVGNGPCNPMAATDPLAGSPSIAHCMRRIIAAEGSHAVFKGIAPRILFHTPAAAICWTTYEQMKLLLAPQ
jgi:solute carrier family 25 iron transporter 28/37